MGTRWYVSDALNVVIKGFSAKILRGSLRASETRQIVRIGIKFLTSQRVLGRSELIIKELGVY